MVVLLAVKAIKEIAMVAVKFRTDHKKRGTNNDMVEHIGNFLNSKQAYFARLISAIQDSPLLENPSEHLQAALEDMEKAAKDFALLIGETSLKIEKLTNVTNPASKIYRIVTSQEKDTIEPKLCRMMTQLGQSADLFADAVNCVRDLLNFVRDDEQRRSAEERDLALQEGIIKALASTLLNAQATNDFNSKSPQQQQLSVGSAPALRSFGRLSEPVYDEPPPYYPMESDSAAMVAAMADPVAAETPFAEKQVANTSNIRETLAAFFLERVSLKLNERIPTPQAEVTVHKCLLDVDDDNSEAMLCTVTSLDSTASENPTARAQIDSVIRSLANLRSSSLLKTFGVVEANADARTSFGIVSELPRYGTLAEMLTRRPSSSSSDAHEAPAWSSMCLRWRLLLMRDIVDGVRALHKGKAARPHGAISLHSVFVTSRNSTDPKECPFACRLGDIGLAHLPAVNQQRLRPVDFCAPELASSIDSEPTFEGDIFALGLVLWCMATESTSAFASFAPDTEEGANRLRQHIVVHDAAAAPPAFPAPGTRLVSNLGTEFLADIPHAVCQLLTSLLVASPCNRQLDLHDVRLDLSTHLARLPQPTPQNATLTDTTLATAFSGLRLLGSDEAHSNGTADSACLDEPTEESVVAMLANVSAALDNRNLQEVTVIANKFAREVGLKYVTEAMQRFPKSSSVIVTATTVVTKLVRVNTDCARAAGFTGLLPQILLALHNHSTSPEVHTSCLNALRGLLSTNTNAHKIASSDDMLEAVLYSSNIFEHEASVNASITAVLLRIMNLECGDEIIAKLFRLDIVSTIARLLRNVAASDNVHLMSVRAPTLACFLRLCRAGGARAKTMVEALADLQPLVTILLCREKANLTARRLATEVVLVIAKAYEPDQAWSLLSKFHLPHLLVSDCGLDAESIDDPDMLVPVLAFIGHFVESASNPRAHALSRCVAQLADWGAYQVCLLTIAHFDVVPGYCGLAKDCLVALWSAMGSHLVDGERWSEQVCPLIWDMRRSAKDISSLSETLLSTGHGEASAQAVSLSRTLMCHQLTATILLDERYPAIAIDDTECLPLIIEAIQVVQNKASRARLPRQQSSAGAIPAVAKAVAANTKAAAQPPLSTESSNVSSVEDQGEDSTGEKQANESALRFLLEGIGEQVANNCCATENGAEVLRNHLCASLLTSTENSKMCVSEELTARASVGVVAHSLTAVQFDKVVGERVAAPYQVEVRGRRSTSVISVLKEMRILIFGESSVSTSASNAEDREVTALFCLAIAYTTQRMLRKLATQCATAGVNVDWDEASRTLWSIAALATAPVFAYTMLCIPKQTASIESNQETTSATHSIVQALGVIVERAIASGRKDVSEEAFKVDNAGDSTSDTTAAACTTAAHACQLALLLQRGATTLSAKQGQVHRRVVSSVLRQIAMFHGTHNASVEFHDMNEGSHEEEDDEEEGEEGLVDESTAVAQDALVELRTELVQALSGGTLGNDSATTELLSGVLLMLTRFSLAGFSESQAMANAGSLKEVVRIARQLLANASTPTTTTQWVLVASLEAIGMASVKGLLSVSEHDLYEMLKTAKANGPCGGSSTDTSGVGFELLVELTVAQGCRRVLLATVEADDSPPSWSDAVFVGSLKRLVHDDSNSDEATTVALKQAREYTTTMVETTLQRINEVGDLAVAWRIVSMYTTTCPSSLRDAAHARIVGFMKTLTYDEALDCACKHAVAGESQPFVFEGEGQSEAFYIMMQSVAMGGTAGPGADSGSTASVQAYRRMARATVTFACSFAGSGEFEALSALNALLVLLQQSPQAVGSLGASVLEALPVALVQLHYQRGQLLPYIAQLVVNIIRARSLDANLGRAASALAKWVPTQETKKGEEAPVIPDEVLVMTGTIAGMVERTAASRPIDLTSRMWWKRSMRLRDRLLQAAWVPDSALQSCMTCGREFMLLIRRHHCRGCGWVVCSVCAPAKKSDLVVLMGTEQPVRVCVCCKALMGEPAPSLSAQAANAVRVSAYKRFGISNATAESLVASAGNPEAETMAKWSLEDLTCTLVCAVAQLHCQLDIQSRKNTFQLLADADGTAKMVLKIIGEETFSAMGSRLWIRAGFGACMFAFVAEPAAEPATLVLATRALASVCEQGGPAVTHALRAIGPKDAAKPGSAFGVAFMAARCDPGGEGEKVAARALKVLLTNCTSKAATTRATSVMAALGVATQGRVADVLDKLPSALAESSLTYQLPPRTSEYVCSLRGARVAGGLPAWAASKNTPACEKCATAFGFTLFRKRCHCCGLVICSDCSKGMQAVPPFWLPDPKKRVTDVKARRLSTSSVGAMPICGDGGQRVCADCFEALGAKESATCYTGENDDNDDDADSPEMCQGEEGE